VETTLLFKAMAIPISQISIVFVGAYSFIFLARRTTLKWLELRFCYCLSNIPRYHKHIVTSLNGDGGL